MQLHLIRKLVTTHGDPVKKKWRQGNFILPQSLLSSKPAKSDSDSMENHIQVTQNQVAQNGRCFEELYDLF
jgi:hypothetical protein